MRHASLAVLALAFSCTACIFVVRSRDDDALRYLRNRLGSNVREELPPPELGITPEAWRIHLSALLVDGHNDWPWALREKGFLSLDGLDLRASQPQFATDLPRLRSGGVGAQFWSVFVPADSAQTGDALEQTLEQVDLVHRICERYPDAFELARTADDIERIHRDGKIASLIGVEGGHSIEDSLANLRILYALGARYMTLTHSDTLAWADAATDAPKSDGLSAFGEDVVRTMNELGMLIDISHVSPATMQDALRVSRAPIIASHSSCYALAPHARNVPDEILVELKDNGGVVMLNFFSGFLVREGAEKMAHAFDVWRELRAQYPDAADAQKAMDAWRAENPIPHGSVADLVDHIDHVVELAGVDHVGLGSDFDGIDVLPDGLEDVSTYPRVTQELLDRGYSAADCRKILGGNALRVLREAEQVARERKGH